MLAVPVEYGDGVGIDVNRPRAVRNIQETLLRLHVRLHNLWQTSA